MILFWRMKKKKKLKIKYMDASIIKESVIKDALSVQSFSLVDFAMIFQSLKMRWTPKKITKSTVIKQQRFAANIVNMYNLQSKIVIIAKLNLLGIFVIYAIYSMTNIKKNKYFIVMDVEFVELEEEKTSFIVMFVAAVLVQVKRIIMFVQLKNLNKIVRFV